MRKTFSIQNGFNQHNACMMNVWLMCSIYFIIATSIKGQNLTSPCDTVPSLRHSSPSASSSPLYYSSASEDTQELKITCSPFSCTSAKSKHSSKSSLKVIIKRNSKKRRKSLPASGSTSNNTRRKANGDERKSSPSPTRALLKSQSDTSSSLTGSSPGSLADELEKLSASSELSSLNKYSQQGSSDSQGISVYC